MPTTSSNPKPLTLSLPDKSLQIQFVWTGDRYAHRFCLPDGTGVQSVEGDASDVWPASPPLQQLSLEQCDGSDVILGVGAAGRSHWSVSVQTTEKSGLPAFKLELACRSSEACDRVGSRYLNSDLVAITPLAGSESRLDSGGILLVKPSATELGKTICWAYEVASAAH